MRPEDIVFVLVGGACVNLVSEWFVCMIDTSLSQSLKTFTLEQLTL